MTLSTTLLVLALCYSAGICLGLLLAVFLLLDRRGNAEANRWLAAAIAALAILTFGSLLEDTRLVLSMPHLGHTTDWLIFAVGPCIWLYVRSLTGQRVQGRWRIGVHFIPTLLIVALLVPFYALNAVEKRAELDAELAALPYETNVPLIIAAVQMLLYWIVALRVLVRYADSLRDQYAAIERLSFRWLRVMLIVCLAVWAIWIAGQILHLDWAVVPNALAVPLALYMLAYLGLRQPAVFAQRAEAVIVTPTVESAANSSSESKYRRDSLDTTRVSEYLTRLDQLMETEKPWLENELTLSELAQRAGLSTHHLSQLINGQLERTFYDYINERRVREVQRCLRDPAYADEPILQIALAAGFNSKAAFNAAFKQWTGMTPSHYRRTASDSAINATSIRPTGSGVRPDLSAKTTLP